MFSFKLQTFKRNNFLLLNRFLCSAAKPFFITTPIFYVNDKPHIGHLYSALLADVTARWNRNKNKKVFFTTGTDEHGLKIQKTAEQLNKTPKEHCDYYSNQFKQLFSTYNIQYDYFIRTTDENHKVAVEYLWNKLKEKGKIEGGEFNGYYCTADEEFLKVKDVYFDQAEGKHKSSFSHRPVEPLVEFNYFFNFSAEERGEIENWLKGLDKNNSFIPSERVALILNNLHQFANQISISRDSSRVSWAIPCPGDPSQRIYVWFDALINYLTSTGYPNENFKSIWPPDVQILGKDIATFHSIYWPAFLIAAGLELPKKMVCHAHWTKDHIKMSKSIGNVVDPVPLAEKYQVDTLRYYFIKEGGIHNDGDFSYESLSKNLNDLYNNYGNLLLRTTSKLVNRSQSYPSHTLDTSSDLCNEIITSISTLPSRVDRHFENFEFYQGVELILDVLRIVNKYVEHSKPWSLAKSSDSADLLLLNQVIYISYEVLRISSILLRSIMPTIADSCLDALAIPANHRTFDFACLRASDSICGASLPEQQTKLFKKE